MNRGLALAILGVACLAQLAVPALFIWRAERVLEHGAVYRFETAPVDPYDAFRGRYVALQFEQSTVDRAGMADQPFGKRIYATLTTDADGFAEIDALSLTPPAEGDYIEAKVQGVGPEQVFLQLPFDRYYMPEELAPAAETAYRRGQWNGDLESYAEVRVHEGRAAITELYLDGIPIADYVRRELRENP